MEKTLEFPDLLRLIDERSDAFRAAVASAPGLDVRVPTCPEWTLSDLVRHLGEGRRKWAVIVAAGPADAPPDTSQSAARAVPRGARPCWTGGPHRRGNYWTRSASPARGAAAGVGGGTSQSPRAPRGRCRTRWRSTVSTRSCPPAARRRAPGRTSPPSSTTTRPRVVPGASCSPPTARTVAGEHPDAADASLRGTAGELVLALYGRVPVDSLEVGGDRRLFDRLLAWDPEG
ncbi:maleylpyruvate isomerase N-terminal domain-containing protein [Streptomyces sp. NPDC059718]